MTMVHGCYELTGAGCVITHVGTEQRLTLMSATRDGVDVLEYRDADLAIEVRASNLRERSTRSEFVRQSQLIDWSDHRHGDVRLSFGLWRRVSFFLLDALPSMMAQLRPAERQSATLLGGWRNGTWDDDANLGCWTDGPLGGSNEKAILEPHALVPLDAVPSDWRFVPVEGRLRASNPVTEPSSDRFLLHRQPFDERPTVIGPSWSAVAAALETSGRFVEQTSGAILYPRYVAPVSRINHATEAMVYGYAAERHGYSFDASFGQYVGEAYVGLRTEEAACFRHELIPSAGASHRQLQPSLREERMFAVADVAHCAARIERDRFRAGERPSAINAFPAIEDQSREHGPVAADRVHEGVSFGRNFGLWGMPFSMLNHRAQVSTSFHRPLSNPDWVNPRPDWTPIDPIGC